MRFRQQDDSAENEETAEKTGVSSTVLAERVGFDLPGFHNWIRVLKLSRNCLIAMTCLFLVGQGHLWLFGVLDDHDVHRDPRDPARLHVATLRGGAGSVMRTVRTFRDATRAD